MTPEQIIELACRHGSCGAVRYVSGDPSQTISEWCFRPEALIAFAQSVIEGERDTTTIKVPTVVWDKLKDVNTVTDLIKALKSAEEE